MAQPDRQTGTAVVALSLESATIRVKYAVRRRVDADLIIVVLLLLWLVAQRRCCLLLQRR